MSVLAQRLLMAVFRLHVLSQVSAWGLWLLCSSPARAAALGRHLCTSAAVQSHQSLKFALPEAGDCRMGLQRSLLNYRFPWQQAVIWGSSLWDLPLCKAGSLTEGTWPPLPLPLLLPYLSMCQECAFCFGENKHESSCLQPACSWGVKRQPQVEEKFCSGVSVLTQDTEEGGNQIFISFYADFPFLSGHASPHTAFH